jgi:hypothetical protein
MLSFKSLAIERRSRQLLNLIRIYCNSSKTDRISVYTPNPNSLIMSKQQKRIRPLTGHFLGWGDDRTPHRYFKLATANGDRLVKVAKSLRPHIQEWQPGIWLTLLTQETICRETGVRKIKVKQLLGAPSIDPDRPPVASSPTVPTKIQVCQGSSCCRHVSNRVCQSMPVYLDRQDLPDRVQQHQISIPTTIRQSPG